MPGRPSGRAEAAQGAVAASAAAAGRPSGGRSQPPFQVQSTEFLVSGFKEQTRRVPPSSRVRLVLSGGGHGPPCGTATVAPGPGTPAAKAPGGILVMPED